MNKLAKELNRLVKENLKQYLPHIKKRELIDNGEIYYSKPNSGTAYDWYVNEIISDFTVYYNDEKKFGAIKMRLNLKGDVTISIYDDHGETLIKKLKTHIEIPKEEMFKLAVILKIEVDDKNIWGQSLGKINTDMKIPEEQIKEFENTKEEHKETIEIGRAFSKMAATSKRLLEENWKVGKMYREKPHDENDSGWRFIAGNEDDEYFTNYENIIRISVKDMFMLDQSIWNHIGDPIGTILIRTRKGTLEHADKKKKPFMKKRKDI